MTLMRRGRDPLAGFGSLQEAVRDMLVTWPFGERELLSLADWTPSKLAVEELAKFSRPVTDVKEKDQVATISAHGDSAFGALEEKTTDTGPAMPDFG